MARLLFEIHTAVQARKVARYIVEESQRNPPHKEQLWILNDPPLFVGDSVRSLSDYTAFDESIRRQLRGETNEFLDFMLAELMAAGLTPTPLVQLTPDHTGATICFSIQPIVTTPAPASP